MKNSIKTCDRCLFWTLSEQKPNIGLCSCDKFVYAEGSQKIPEDGLGYRDNDGMGADFFTAGKFGCIHQKSRAYFNLKVGDTVICLKDCGVDDIKLIATRDDPAYIYERTFTEGKEYTIIEAGDLAPDDPIKIVSMINDHGENHTWDNEDYPNQDGGDFEKYFTVKQ